MKRRACLLLLATVLLTSCEKRPPARPPTPTIPAANEVSAFPLPDFNPARQDHQRIEQAIREALGQPKGAVTRKALADLRRLGGFRLASSQITDVRPLSGLNGLHELWLQNNQISEIQALSDLTELKSLSLHGNQVADLSPLKGLNALRELSLSANHISDLSTLKGPDNLAILHLSHNQITDLSPLAQFKKLQTLDLSSNEMSSLRGLRQFPVLENLEVGGNQITDLGPLSGSRALKTLALDKNSIANVQGLANCLTLETLSLSFNKITNLTPLSGLKNLRLLNLNNNNVASLKPLAKSKSLRQLLLSDNRATSLQSLSGHKSLEVLNITHNLIESLEGLEQCLSLRRLECIFNNVRDLTPLAKLTALEELYLNGNQVTNLTPLTGLTNLTSLHLSHGHIKNLSALSGMTRLRNLDLNNNNLTSLQPLENCKVIQNLNLTDNDIANLNPITAFKNLVELRLKGNRIEDISHVAKLDKLMHLDLAFNQITNATPLVGLKYLRSLYLNNNRITNLKGIEGCPRLEVLNLTSNPVTDLAPLTKLSQLRKLYMDASNIATLSPLAGLGKLARLDLAGTSSLPKAEIDNLRKALPNCRIQEVGLTLKTEAVGEGYLLLSPISSTSTYLVNMKGKVVHEWPSIYRPHLAVYLMEDGSILRTCQPHSSPTIEGGPTFQGGGIQRISWEGKVLWDFHKYKFHHDIEPLPNGNILAISSDQVSNQNAVAAGRNPKTLNQRGLMPDAILEIQPIGPRGGKVVWEWHAWDHLVQDFDASKKNFGQVADHTELLDINYLGGIQGSNLHDWLHLNSIDYHPGLDQILLSSHRFNEIWIIDHSTTTQQAAGHRGGLSGRGGDLLYRWGNPMSYKTGTRADQQLFRQHDARWIPPNLEEAGRILVFNNGQRQVGRRYSSVDELIPPLDKNGNYTKLSNKPFDPERPDWTYTAPTKSDFFSRNISGAHRRANGNTLICSGAPGVIFEISRDGKKVWEYINPHHGLPGSQWGRGPGRPQRRGRPGQRPVFRATLFAADHPALKGRTFNREPAE